MRCPPRNVLDAAIVLSLTLGFGGACGETTRTRTVSYEAGANVSPELLAKMRAETAKSMLRTLHDQGFWPANSTGWNAGERAVIAAVLPVMRSVVGPGPNELLPVYRVSQTADGFQVNVACFERLPDGGLLTPFSVMSFEVSQDLKVVRPLGTV